ncbi:glycoside hydrolase family 6 protein [Streptomyces varsoviensis]|uniref:glycoside hydrolase family 6 protein n=1 Tax=Streptomyces varsoviensis TaxID=67373 RepID=UPI0033C3DD53
MTEQRASGRTRTARAATGLLMSMGLLTPIVWAASHDVRAAPATAPATGPLLAPAFAAALDLGQYSPFWVDPHSQARQQTREIAKRGRPRDAALLRRIADRPTAVWLTERDPADHVRRATEDATRSGRIPVFVAYNIPGRDCGQYSSGGAADDDEYRQWVGRIADGIGDRRAVVILEPDAAPQAATGCDGQARLDARTESGSAAGLRPAPGPRSDRRALLAHAVRTLKARPGAAVYVDAGNAGWIRDVHQIADVLKSAGVNAADGFALNVSSFQTTRASREYGDRLSAALGGAHYVIDTSRNGKGPVPENANGKDSGEPWCNPPGRALGTPPTTRTGSPIVDAFLWIKRPGESDGACRGGPPAGQWWTEYALGLAREAMSDSYPGVLGRGDDDDQPGANPSTDARD